MMHSEIWKKILMFILVCPIVFHQSHCKSDPNSSLAAKRKRLSHKARKMFYHAYDNYMTYAFPHDELKPLTKTSTDSLSELGNLKLEHLPEQYNGSALTLIESLSSLVILGNQTEFEKAVLWLSEHMTFDVDVRINLFEGNIRLLGGLVSAHSLATDSTNRLIQGTYENQLLELAEDLGRRFLPAFDTPTGLPYAWINLKHGVMDNETTETSTSGCGSLILEMGALSRLTGDPRFESAALRALRKLWSMRSSLNLFGCELRRLSIIPESRPIPTSNSDREPEPWPGFLLRDSFSTEIVNSISPEDLRPTVKLCIDGLNSKSIAIRRSAAAKLRLLAKNRPDNRALIGDAGAIPALIRLLRYSDPFTQEHAVTALFNLSLYETNTALMSNAGAVKPLIYVLKTGTEISKQNAACVLLNLALVDDKNKLSIGACGAIPPLVALLESYSDRGKKDALTTLYKLCSLKLNKERAVNAGAARLLVRLIGEQGTGLAEKALVVLNSLAAIDSGSEAIVEEGGIAALVEAIEDGTDKGKEFVVQTLLQLCGDSFKNRGLLVREGGIPPLAALSRSGTAKAKQKAKKLLEYLREPRQEASTSTH